MSFCSYLPQLEQRKLHTLIWEIQISCKQSQCRCIVANSYISEVIKRSLKMSKALKKYVEVTDMNKEGKALYFLATSINYVGFLYT